MDVPINTTGTEHTDVIMGSLGPGLTENMIEELVAKGSRSYQLMRSR